MDEINHESASFTEGLSKDADLDFHAYVEALETQVRSYIARFFADKKFYCGGPIPKSLLYSRANLNLVLNTDFCEGVDVCHEVVGRLRPPRGLSPKVYAIYWINKGLGMARQCGVPKPLQAGMILLYFKLCKGWSVPAVVNPPPKIAA